MSMARLLQATGRLEEAETTENQINSTRETYRAAAVRGSILYFVIADLALIGPMYQYSLNFFMRMFNDCIVNSRETNSFSKFDMYTNEILWNVGGEHGTMTLIDINGKMYSPGENSLHYGQHNLEYFGNDEFMMFE